MIPPPKDSGVRENFSTGSRRDTRAGKGRYDLLPTRALELLAIHFENGSVKYGDRNWEKGQPLSRYLDSALRHLFKHLQGMRDEPHAVAAAWNILCLIDTERRVQEGLLPKELDDLSVFTSSPTQSNTDPCITALREKLKAEDAIKSAQSPKTATEVNQFVANGPCPQCGQPSYRDQSNGVIWCQAELSSEQRRMLLSGL